MRIDLVSGPEADRRLADAAYLERWRDLAAGDAKLTLPQEPEFALAWYRAYRETHAPLLVEGRSPGGELVALMPLARRAQDGALGHAGAHQAEYHGWIARPEHDEEFPAHAVRRLHEEAGFGTWAWRWMPPGAPAGWTRSELLSDAGLFVVEEERPSPVWDLRDRDKLQRVLGSRSIRSKLNRYRRRGEVRLERVRDPARTAELLRVLARQCDYRQEVIHSVRPFADDPRKAAFFVERQAFPDANHFTVLWCGDLPLAFHFGACDGATCLLGLSSYAPSESRDSPGTLILIELGRSLSEAGYARFDLTPGNDPYKQRFANAEVPLRRITIHASRLRRWRGGLAVRARHAVLARTASGDQRERERWHGVQRRLGPLARDLLGGRVAGLLAAWRRRRAAVRPLRFVPPAAASGAPVAAGPGAGAEPVRVQAWEDLLELGGAAAIGSRRELLADSLERFSNGEVLYTAPAGGRTAWIGWRAPDRSEPVAPEADGEPRLRLLSVLRSDPGAAEVAALGACLARMLDDGGPAARASGVRVDPGDRALRAALAELGWRTAPGVPGAPGAPRDERAPR